VWTGSKGREFIVVSVIPTVATGNTNAPTIMIGEKGAARIREDTAASSAGAAAPARSAE
jgi:choline dehydrogenase